MSRFETIFSNLGKQPRLLIEAELTPVQGDRFQPTGFPDLGAATYKRPDGTPMLLVESAQSMANRLEEICWDKAEDKIIAPLEGLSHVVVNLGSGTKTSSIQEAHRLNSPYIINDEKLKKRIVDEVGSKDTGPLDIRKLAQSVFKLDAGSILHGIFLEKVAGRLRLQRLLSGFIEAENIETVSSGGVKLDRVNPSAEGGAKEGFGNVPYARTEYAAKRIVAYFNLDLATLRGYGLGENAEKLIVALTLYKMLRLLSEGMRLRTACDFDMKSLTVTRPAAGVDLSKYEELLSELEAALPQMIQACEFGDQPLSV
ncbi:MAG: CRISPR-associated protein Csb1 [Acidobacteriota bacterium]|jgi:CRISPR-associated protein Csb1|nr:CRISPR-associated protein Csb1 [Acidobacteriota bacterium]